VAALAAGLTPIVCVGETLAQREAGETEAVVGGQLQAVLELLRRRVAKIVVAYEPVWAIGTGKTATPEMAQEVHARLRAQLRVRIAAAAGVQILYGGSMKPDNARNCWRSRYRWRADRWGGVEAAGFSRYYPGGLVR
jgi:triosephosphate isomerase